MPLVVFTEVHRVPKLSILMQALFGAHREHSRSTQTHQREETQEEHHGMRASKCVCCHSRALFLIDTTYLTFSLSGVSGETGGE